MGCFFVCESVKVRSCFEMHFLAFFGVESSTSSITFGFQKSAGNPCVDLRNRLARHAGA